jgi:hypothetical protein
MSRYNAGTFKQTSLSNSHTGFYSGYWSSTTRILEKQFSILLLCFTIMALPFSLNIIQIGDGTQTTMPYDMQNLLAEENSLDGTWKQPPREKTP